MCRRKFRARVNDLKRMKYSLQNCGNMFINGCLLHIDREQWAWDKKKTLVQMC